MLRGALLVFVAGWILWFWIDKNPMALGPLPYPVAGDYAANFQVAVDLLKQMRIKAAFVYLWKAHYLVISLACGLLVGALLNVVSRRLSRNKLLKLYFPEKKKRSEQAPADRTG